jgi:hypothetical protein
MTMGKVKKLVAGSVATVSRPGGGVCDALGQYNVPDDGSNLHVRDLAPGSYVAVDSTGREVAFEVSRHEEYAVIPVVGAKGEDEPTDDPNPDPDDAPGVDEGRRPIPNLPHNQPPEELEGE